jgi:hypothetical protein
MFVRIAAGFLQAAAGVVVGGLWRGRHPVDGPGGLAEQFAHGLAHYAYFLVATPLGWLALWLFCEGLMRVLAAAMDQPFSTLPVVLARAAWRLRPEKKLPADLVFEHDDGFIIDSARNYDWHALTTVELDGAHYAVERQEGTSERPHRYRLTPITPEHVVRTVTRYARTPSG